MHLLTPSLPSLTMIESSARLFLRLTKLYLSIQFANRMNLIVSIIRPFKWQIKELIIVTTREFVLLGYEINRWSMVLVM